MTLYNVSLVKNFNKTEEFMDDKISSSSRRIALLGKVCNFVYFLRRYHIRIYSLWLYNYIIKIS